jgi:hypothetical protein
LKAFDESFTIKFANMKKIHQWPIALFLLGMVSLLVGFTNFHKKNEMAMQGLKSEDKGFAVVELFTSEGCSSCPPADELIARVQKEDSNDPVYILAFHVDYWDHLGWKDQFSDPDYSKRQNQYADWLKLKTIYTPQIVVNGKTEFVGSDQNALHAAINQGLNLKAASNLMLKTNLSNGQLVVDYQTNATLAQSSLVVSLVQKSGQSNIKAGENAGLSITHVQIVRKLLVETIHTNSGGIRIALPQDYKASEWEVIGFVQNKTTGAILSAAKSDIVFSSAP